MGPIKQVAKYINNQYVVITTDYTTKWVEAKALKNNTTKSIAKFFFENIITQFGCPTHLVNDQGSHFINDIIEVLTTKFKITHHKSTTYYPQDNGQVELTNKTFKRLLAKMVNNGITLIGMGCHVANNTMGILNNIEGHDTTYPL